LRIKEWQAEESLMKNRKREILRRCARQNDTPWLFVAAENHIRAAPQRHSIELT
jgi:hypothetical protein